MHGLQLVFIYSLRGLETQIRFTISVKWNVASSETSDRLERTWQR